MAAIRRRPPAPPIVKDKPMRLRSLLILAVILPALVVQARSAPLARGEGAGEKLPRVALLVDDPDLEALLIAGFAGVETLGRAELPKAAAERLLTGGSLGLTNAEVALVVERDGERGVVKVVQCESAATAVVLELPKMPAEETARWIVARTRPLLGAVADPMRPRISLPGLRFVTDSAENRAAERAINLMLTARLQARGAVVLERWRMRDLVFEKSLAAQESPFWKAARIVDGSVSAAGGKLAARVRIRDAAGTETTVAAEGGTAEDLVEDVSTRVLTARWKTEVGTKNETEAAVFLAEAKWMLEHGLPREAWQATESALALGANPRREAEMLRVKAAAMCAYPGDFQRMVLRDMSYRANAFSPSELPARVASVTEAILMAGDYATAYPADGQLDWSGQSSSVLGTGALYTGLKILRIAQDVGWARENESGVRGLREAVRRLVGLLEPAMPGQQRRVFYVYLGNYAGYWNETPGEAIAFYRRILDPHFDGGVMAWPDVIRAELTYNIRPCPPFLVGTAPKSDFPAGIGPWLVPARDGQAAVAAWGSFLDELEGSPNVLSQADGLALRWQSTADINARIALAERIVDFLAAHVDLLTGPEGLAIFGEMAGPLRESGRLDGFALAQKKAVGVFLALLRSKSPVSPVIIQHIRTLFYYNKANGSEEQGRELLAALDARRAMTFVDWKERAAIDDARSVIWKRFPALRPPDNTAGALMVRSLWIADEHASDHSPGLGGINAHTAVWHDGHLWMLDAHRGNLWRVDPGSGATTVVFPENPPKTNPYSLLVPWGRRFAITAENGVWVLNETGGRWDMLDLPRTRYLIGVAEGVLWAVSGETGRSGVAKNTEGGAIYRVSPELKCELVASSRRRPAVHPLDVSLTGAPFTLIPSSGGGVLIGTRGGGEIFTFFDTASAVALQIANKRYVGSLNTTGTPGLLMRCRHPNGDRSRSRCVELVDTRKDELLVSHPVFANPDKVRFPYPKKGVDLPATDYAAARRGEGIDVLAWSAAGSPWGAAEAWLLRMESGGGYVRPLRFDWSTETARRVRACGKDPKVFRYPKPGTSDLIVTDRGLVIMGSAMDGFWFVPQEDLEAPQTLDGDNGVK